MPIVVCMHKCDACLIIHVYLYIYIYLYIGTGLDRSTQWKFGVSLGASPRGFTVDLAHGSTDETVAETLGNLGPFNWN